MFEDEKPFILLKLSFCEQNELKSKDLIQKFHKYNSDNFRLAISWKTRKIKSLFNTKDKNRYPACTIYYGECEQCGDNYTDEAVWNTLTRWLERNNPDHKSEPAEHMKRNIEHVFKWKLSCPAPSQRHLRKNLERIFIALYKPLNNQTSLDRLMLFRMV